MKRVLICFGNKRYEHCKQRLKLSSENYFDKVISYDEKDIDEEFYNANKKLFKDVKGWSYGLWKPYLILKTLSGLKEGDFCFYVDSTCLFHRDPDLLFGMCTDSGGILLFKSTNHVNCRWTKADCFNLMGLTEDKYIYGAQADASIQLYQKNPESIRFLNELLHHSANYNCISDAPNITGNNHPEFRDHRHDQSILSLLAIKHNVELNETPTKDGYYPGNNFIKIMELKRDFVVPELQFKKVYAYLSKAIYARLHHKSFPGDSFISVDINLHSFYFTLELINVYHQGNPVSKDFFPTLEKELVFAENDDLESLQFFENFFRDNKVKLTAMTYSIWNGKSRSDYSRDWKKICLDEFISKGFSIRIFLHLYFIINEQFGLPVNYLIYTINYSHSLLQIAEKV